MKKKRNFLQAALTQIRHLYEEIEEVGLSALRTSLPKAIRIGELLCRVRGGHKGKWLIWIDKNLPFSRATAYNYIGLYQRRGELKLLNVRNLAGAYRLLYPPVLLLGKAEPTSDNVTDENLSLATERTAETPASPAEEVESAPAEQEPMQPERKSRSHRRIMREISNPQLDKAMGQLFANRLQKMAAAISGQDREPFKGFGKEVAAQAEVVRAHGERLSNGKT